MPEELSAAVAAVVREAVAERGWSGRELGRRIDLHPSVIAYKLAGERAFDLADLAKIGEALGVTVRDLIGKAEDRTV